MSAQAITNPVDRAVFDAQAALATFNTGLAEVLARYDDPGLTDYEKRCRMAARIYQLELERKARD
jgi:hypothetical protein